MLAVMQPKNYLMHGLGVGGGRGRPKGSRNGYISPGAAYMKDYKIQGEKVEGVSGAQETKDRYAREQISKLSSKTANLPSANKSGTETSRGNDVRSGSSERVPLDFRVEDIVKNAKNNPPPKEENYNLPLGLNNRVYDDVKNKNAPEHLKIESTLTGWVPNDTSAGVKPISENLRDGFNDGNSRAKVASEDAASSMKQGQSIFERITSGIGDAWNKGLSWLKTAGRAIVDFGKAAWDKIVSGATAIGDAAKRGYDAASNWVQQAGRDAKDAVSNARDNARDFILNKAIPWAQQAGRDIGDTATNAYNAASGWVQNQAVPWVQQAGKDVSKAYFDTTNGMYNWWNDTNDSNGHHEGAKTRIGNWFNQAGRDIGDTATNAYNAASGWANQAGRDIGNAATNAYNAASGWVNQAGRDIGDTATNAYNAASGWANQAGRDIGNAATNAYNAASGWVNQAGRDIGDTATNAYNAASGWVQNQAVPWARQAAQDAGNFVNDNVIQPVGFAAQRGAAYVNDLGRGDARSQNSRDIRGLLMNASNAAASVGRSIPSEAANWTVGQLEDYLWSIGVNPASIR